MKLLIVEDNVSVRRLIVRIVAGLTKDIRECGDGLTAVAAYLDYRPDIVLMDIEMKDLDGIAATHKIREVDSAARIVMVTNYDDTALREVASRAGACGYVLKQDLLELKQVLKLLDEDHH